MNDPSTQASEKTLRILDILASHPHLSQREIAHQAGISLGLVNLIIKRLIQTGHIKVANINARKIEYMLTPKGFQEKTRHSAAYLLKTIRTFREIHQQTSALVQKLLAQGHSLFALRGHSEVTDLLELSFKEVGTGMVQYRHLGEDEAPLPGELVLDCRLDELTGPYGISILENLLSLPISEHSASKVPVTQS